MTSSRVRMLAAVLAIIGLQEWWAQRGPAVTPVVITPEPNLVALIAIVLVAALVFYGRRAERAS